MSKPTGGVKRSIDDVAPEWHASYHPTAAPSSSSSASINKRRNDDGGGHGQKKARTSISGSSQQPEKRLKRIRNCEALPGSSRDLVNGRAGSVRRREGHSCLMILHTIAELEAFNT